MAMMMMLCFNCRHKESAGPARADCVKSFIKADDWLLCANDSKPSAN